MANLALASVIRVFDANGDPVPGALVRLYDSGTTTARTAYSDAALTTPLSWPLVADGAGVLPPFQVGPGAVKAVISTAADAILYTVDPCIVTSSDATGAAGISFNPTAELPYDNVQDAIEGAAASAASGFAPYGLGITGNAALLANIDATNIAAGSYRFDATTTGTFPTGVTAAQGGTIVMTRETSALATMALKPSNSDKTWDRRQSTTWLLWKQRVFVDGTGVRGDLTRYGATTWESLPVGTVGKVVSSDGTDVVYATPGKIATETGLTGLAQKDIVLPAGFTVYRLVLWDVIPGTTGASLQIRVSTDGGSSFISTGSYTAMGSILAASSTNAGTIANTVAGTAGILTGALATSTGKEASGELMIVPGAAQFVLRGGMSYETNLSTDGIQSLVRVRNAAASVNAIRLFMSTGNIGLSYALIGVA